MSRKSSRDAPRGRQTLTLTKMAQRLGVSTATVSNAFNRPDQLSAALREHILAECTKAGYGGPNAAARSLRTGRTGIIGVALSNYLSYSFTDPVAHQFLSGLAEIFEEQEYSLLLTPSREHLSLHRGFQGFADGFIVYGPPREEELEQLVAQNKPIVTVDFVLDGYPSVNIDNRGSAAALAQHALRSRSSAVSILGLRLMNVNEVCPIDEDQLFEETRTITRQRLSGFLSAIASAGVEIPKEKIWHVPDNTHLLGLEAAKRALSANPRPDVLLCMSDRIALAAIQAARGLGLRVPDDVRVTGFDGIPEAATHRPSLTTVHQESLLKGRRAAEVLLAHETATTSLVLPTRLTVRESCP